MHFFFQVLYFICKNILPNYFNPKVINQIIYKIFGIDHKNNEFSATENIRNIIDMHEDEGDLHKDESDMINAILDLKEITVEKIMTHRKIFFL